MEIVATKSLARSNRSSEDLVSRNVNHPAESHARKVRAPNKIQRDPPRPVLNRRRLPRIGLLTGLAVTVCLAALHVRSTSASYCRIDKAWVDTPDNEKLKKCASRILNVTPVPGNTEKYYTTKPISQLRNYYGEQRDLCVECNNRYWCCLNDWKIRSGLPSEKCAARQKPHLNNNPNTFTRLEDQDLCWFCYDRQERRKDDWSHRRPPINRIDLSDTRVWQAIDLPIRGSRRYETPSHRHRSYFFMVTKHNFWADRDKEYNPFGQWIPTAGDKNTITYYSESRSRRDINDPLYSAELGLWFRVENGNFKKIFYWNVGEGKWLWYQEEEVKNAWKTLGALKNEFTDEVMGVKFCGRNELRKSLEDKPFILRQCNDLIRTLRNKLGYLKRKYPENCKSKRECSTTCRQLKRGGGMCLNPTRKRRGERHHCRVVGCLKSTLSQKTICGDCGTTKPFCYGVTAWVCKDCAIYWTTEYGCKG